MGKQRKYCSKRCQQSGYKNGLSKQKPDTSKRVAELYERFQMAFNHKTGFHGNGGGFFIRVFVAACVFNGYSDNSISKAINRSRSTITKHRLKLLEEEKEIAKEFLENKNYVYGSKYNNFSYRSIK